MLGRTPGPRTGVVFWIAHVHAQLFGARLAQQAPDRRVVLCVCRDEWPIVRAALPSAAAVAAGPLLGLDVRGALRLPRHAAPVVVTCTG
ncbi:hypothetical protein GCM10017771_34460 [Streptomyces capitiformicae]|uniref:Uncharacterized protein n=1 Tax=Streptomyces capitiformicae TaxID=2014920 RepID=A0A919LCA9_9ACTN|nr:hypothetical protein GCM10017771_34460 [Streptomyces capitiformicae]